MEKEDRIEAKRMVEHSEQGEGRVELVAFGREEKWEVIWESSSHSAGEVVELSSGNGRLTDRLLRRWRRPN